MDACLSSMGIGLSFHLSRGGQGVVGMCVVGKIAFLRELGAARWSWSGTCRDE